MKKTPWRSGWLLLPAWIACLCLCTLALVRSGTALPAPPLSDRSELLPWLANTPSDVVALAVLRIIGIGLCGYLLLVTTANIVAAAVRIPLLTRAVDMLSFPPIAQLIRSSVGIGLIASTTISMPAVSWADSPAPSSEVVTMEVIEGEATPTTVTMSVVAPSSMPTSTTTASTTTASTTTTSTTATSPPATSATTASTAPTAASPVAPATSAPTATAPTTAPDSPHHSRPESPALNPTDTDPLGTWAISPGDHLWGVSEITLTARLGRPPTIDETIDYLHALIDLNHSVLAVPNNPDLVYVGQVFALPAITG